jgi:hypothetical protein
MLREHLHSLKKHRKQRPLYVVWQEARPVDGSHSSDGAWDRHEKDTESRFQPTENSLRRRVRKIALDRKHDCRAIVMRKQRMMSLVDFR